MRKATVFSIVIFLVVCALSNAALAQKGPVSRVIIVKTDNLGAYVQQIEKGKTLMKSLGMQGQPRVWRASFAGPEAGTIVVTIEYPSLAALASDYAKVSASSEYQEWIKGLDKMRTIVSDSLYNEW